MKNGFSLDYLKRIASSDRSFQKGVQYYKDGRVGKVGLMSLKNGSVEKASADVEGSGDSYTAELRVGTDGIITSFSCDCPAAYSYYGACKHVIALALAYSALKKSTASVTDIYAKKLMRTAAARTAAEAESEGEQVKLELRLSEGYKSVYADFRIGSKRMYVIQNLYDFADLMQSGGVKKYGKDLTVRHDFTAFDDESLPVLRFMLSRINSGANISGSRYITLSGYDLDEIFSFYHKDRICFENMTMRIVHKAPPISVDIKAAKGGFELSCPQAGDETLMFLGSGEHTYFTYLDDIYITDKAFTGNAADLAETLIYTNNLTVSAEDMPAFWQTVIIPASESLKITADSEASRLSEITLEKSLYLDLPDDSSAAAHLEFAYGNKKHGGFQPKTAETSPDLRGEIAAERLVKKYFPNVDPKTSTAYFKDSDERLYDLLNGGISELSKHMQVYAAKRFDSIMLRPPAAARVGVRLNSGLLELDISSADYTKEELFSLLEDYRSGKKFRRIGSSFVPLDSPALEELSEIAEDLGLTEKEFLKDRIGLPGYRMLYLDSIMKEKTGIAFEKNREFKNAARSFAASDHAVPEELENVLREYQRDGFVWLKTIAENRFGGILADDMGLGKTVQAIALLMSDKQDRESKKLVHIPSLIVCPSSLCTNWKCEFGKFAGGMSAAVVTGNADNRDRILSEYAKYDVLITSYDLLKRDVHLYDGLHFRFQLIDEAQYIKNHATQSAKAVKSIDSEIRFALTGTPVENTLAELWSIFDFIMPGYLFSYTNFKRRYETPIVKNSDEKALKSLKRLSSPFILRRLKTDVLSELPEKNEIIMTADMTEEQSRIYSAEVMSLKQQFADTEDSGSGRMKIEILAGLTRLRQICCDPSVVYEKYSGGSAKLELCVELAESSANAGHKILLFSQFTSMLSIIGKRLEAAGLKTVSLTGATPPSKRQELVNRFNSDDTDVFLISLKAGGTGLNLTGADIVIHFDPWWNISAENQASDRAYRIGQKNNVTVYKLIAKGTIEEKIRELQSAKSELADSLIGTDGGGIAAMSREDLMSLFG